MDQEAEREQEMKVLPWLSQVAVVAASDADVCMDKEQWNRKQDAATYIKVNFAA